MLHRLTDQRSERIPMPLLPNLSCVLGARLVCFSVSWVCKRYSRGLICIATAESRVIDCAERD